MKKQLIISSVCLFSFLFACAQEKDYKVVFDMTSNDTLNQQSLIRQLGLIREYNPSSKLDVVIYGNGLNMVVKNNTAQHAAVQKLLTDKNISFKVCAMTMKRYKVEKSGLLEGVQVVPDGIYEIVKRQQEGWGYIKVAH